MQAQLSNEPLWIPGCPLAVITMDTDTALFTSLIVWLLTKLENFARRRGVDGTDRCDIRVVGQIPTAGGYVLTNARDTDATDHAHRPAVPASQPH